MNMFKDEGGFSISFYQKQREQVKKTIIDTSIAIFKEKGYENTTIDEITKKVGIAKGTFYNFYPSKNQVLINWAAEKLQCLNIHVAMDPNNSLEKNLNIFIDLIIDSIEGEEELFHCYLREILQKHGDKNYNQQFDLLAIYRAIIMNSKEQRTVTETTLDAKIELLNSVLFMGIINWLDKGKPLLGLREHLKTLTRICIYGLLSNGERSGK